MTKHASAFLAVLALAALSVPARAADNVELRAAEHDGYGRIALQWPTPITYEAKVDGQTLVIHFARPFTAQLNIISRNLGHYIANASLSADGMTITAKMVHPFALKSETVGHNIVAIDLIQKNGNAGDQARRANARQRQAHQGAPRRPKSRRPKRAARSQARGAKSTAAREPEQRRSPARRHRRPALRTQSCRAAKAAAASIAPAETTSAAPQASAPASQNASAPGTLAPQLITQGDQTSLRFDWPSPTAAADLSPQRRAMDRLRCFDESRPRRPACPWPGHAFGDRCGAGWDRDGAASRRRRRP